MSTVKQCAVRLIEAMPDDRVIAFIRFIADENEIAKMESEIAANSQYAKTYNSFDEFMQEVDEELKNEV